MPKARKPENKGLPARWRHVHGAYYFQVPPGFEHFWDNKKLFRLGKTLPEAYKEWAERLGSTDKANTIGQLLNRYALEVVPTKDVNTQEYNALYIKALRPVFGHMKPEDIEPQHIYQYVDKRRKKHTDEKKRTRGGLSIAKREVAMFSDVFTKAVKWGVIKAHPFKGEIVLEGEKSRTRYVEDWEIIECFKVGSKRKKGSVQAVQASIRLKLLTGMRQQDILRLQISDIQEDGIHVTPRKTEKTTGKALIYEWSDELRAAVELAKEARPVDISPYLFCNKRGKSHWNETTCKASGWKSMWRRFIDRVIEETNVTEPFTEHDLRAKCASDADSLEHARQLLAHADSKITEKVYRRKPEKVRPLR